MRKPLRHLLVALLLSSPLAAHAQNVPMVDLWLIHHQGDLGTNEATMVVANEEQIIKRAGGVRSLGVYRVFEGGGFENMTSYDVEVDCAKSRVRIKDAQKFSRLMNSFSPAKFSSAWQKSPEPWLVATRDFLCRPAERESRKMEHWGPKPLTAIVETGEAYFRSLQHEQSLRRILQMIDEAFETIPQA